MTETETRPWDVLEGLTARTPRSLETRESTREYIYVEPGILPDPAPRDGIVFRWVRQEFRNEADKNNFWRRTREGWRPVESSEYPELMVELGLGTKSGPVMVGGLILCQAPKELMDQRRKFYNRKAMQQITDADDAYMRSDDERMKKFRERRTQVVFGNGRTVSSITNA